MTIDIKIGKLKIKRFEDVIEEVLDQDNTYTNERKFYLTDFLDIKQCPDEEDGCSEKDTAYPNSAYRSGGISGMCEFFSLVIKELLREIKPDASNDYQYTRIKPHLEKINDLSYSGDIEQHKKRLHWLKFWCNRAVEQYGDEAAIRFS